MEVLHLAYNEWVFAVMLSALLSGGTFLPTDEFKRFSAAKACWFILGFYLAGGVFMWYSTTPYRFLTRGLIAFLACGIIGVVCAEGIRLVTKREHLTGKTEEGKKQADVQQNSQGADSPNIVGDNAHVTYGPSAEEIAKEVLKGIPKPIPKSSPPEHEDEDQKLLRESKEMDRALDSLLYSYMEKHSEMAKRLESWNQGQPIDPDSRKFWMDQVKEQHVAWYQKNYANEAARLRMLLIARTPGVADLSLDYSKPSSIRDVNEVRVDFHNLVEAFEKKLPGQKEDRQ